MTKTYESPAVIITLCEECGGTISIVGDPTSEDVGKDWSICSGCVEEITADCNAVMA